MDIEVLTIVTYVCAAIGGGLMLMCCVLLCLLVYNYCKTSEPSTSQRRYDVVPVNDDRHDVGNRPQSTFQFHKSSLVFQREKKPLFYKRAPIAAKLLKKRGGDVVFTAEELDVPREGRIYKKKFAQRQTKSDWNLAKSRDYEALLQPLRFTADIESQYFDALGPVEEENDSDFDSSAWEDEGATEEEAEDHGKLANKTRNEKPPVTSDDLTVKRRIKALKQLDLQHKAIEAKFYLELLEVESVFWSAFRNPLYAERAKIIAEIPGKGFEGFSDFWLRSMRNSETLTKIIQRHDRPVLKHLQDIKVISPFGSRENASRTYSNFRLEFHFEANDFFTNDCLTKDYKLRYSATEAEQLKRCVADDPSFLTSSDGRPQIVDCKGCKINWCKGKNVTLRPVNKVDKETGEIVTKFAKINSFFNFFAPPNLESGSKMLKENPKAKVLIEMHYDAGIYIKETFVPKVLSFFIGSFHDAPKNALKEVGSNQALIDLVLPMANGVSNGTSANGAETSVTPTLQTKDGLVNGEISNPEMVEVVDTKPSSMAPDAILGSYRLAHSEGFDEFLKALGVGLLNRKLANSVSPVNVIEISGDGVYTVRTETTLRTTEIKFRLDHEFDEPTLDGRLAKSTATRQRNVVTLVQRGDPKKREKDSTVIRDFDGDVMHMELQVDNVVCKRRYVRVDK